MQIYSIIPVLCKIQWNEIYVNSFILHPPPIYVDTTKVN